MNTQQLEIVNDTTNPVIVVLAGPGSGKTATLVARVVECAKRSDASRFAIITFTVAAAKELAERIDKAQPGLAVGYVGTLHGWATRQIKAHGKLIGLSESFSLIDEEQAEDMLEMIKLQHGYKGTKKAVQEAIAASVWVNCTITTHAERVAADFHQQLRSSGTYTFDSLLIYCAMLFESPIAPNAPIHLFVDEYQDSSSMDDRIYQALRKYTTNMFFVADPDQSIYGFRGGDVNNILRLAHSFGVKTYDLSSNYRSGRKICQAATALIHHNTARPDRQTIAANDFDGKIDVLTAPNSISSLQQIALDICDQKPESCAVLFRYNAHVDEAVKYFQSQNIPLARRADLAVPADWRKAKALLAVLANPYNEVTMKYYLKVACPEAAAKMASDAATRYLSINDYFFKFPTEAQSWRETFYKQEVSQESIEKIMAVWNELPTHTIPDLIYALAAEPARRTQGQGLVITTMHGAKGLEFDTVYIAGAEQALTPGSKAGAALEEERRLFYVAVTRAKRRLVLCHAAYRANAFGSKRAVEQQPSQFIAEMNLNR